MFFFTSCESTVCAHDDMVVSFLARVAAFLEAESTRAWFSHELVMLELALVSLHNPERWFRLSNKGISTLYYVTCCNGQDSCLLCLRQQVLWCVGVNWGVNSGRYHGLLK